MVNPVEPPDPGSKNHIPSDPYAAMAWQLPTQKISPDDPWMGFFKTMFPNCPPEQAEHFAGTFKSLMEQYFQNEIQKCQAKAHEAAQRNKRIMQGED